MGQYSGTHVVNVAGAASVGADLIYLSKGGFSIKVTNITGQAPLYFTVDQRGGACTPPTVGGVNSYVVAGVAGSSTNARSDGQTGHVVQVASSASVSYMVEVQSSRATS